MTSMPWRDKAGVTHAWLVANTRLDNHHAGWYTARAPCGAERKLRHGCEDDNRRREATIDCMTCLIRTGERNQ